MRKIVIVVCAAVALAGCSTEPKVYGGTPSMVSVCTPQMGNWQATLAQAQSYCQRYDKNATVIDHVPCEVSAFEALGTMTDFRCE